MISFPKPQLRFGLLLLVAALGGCASAQAYRSSADSLQNAEPYRSASLGQAESASAPRLAMATAASQTDSESLFAQAPLGRPNRPISAANITSVKVFNLDSQCENFEGEVIKLAEDGSLEEAVGLAIANSNNPDFAIDSYRVGEGRFPQEVVVDLRLAPDSERLFSSLSICEGKALFGSIRRTLVENGQFDVTQVLFTAAGEDIIL